VSVRAATADDIPILVGLIGDLAEYERARDQVQLTEQRLHEALFGADAAARCHVADHDGAVVGLALWFRNFSTWTGEPGIYLEDLFVRPEHRGSGHGRALLAALAAECVTRGYTRLEWAVLDWNTPALGFYRSIGAVGQEEWTVQRLSGPALGALAQDSGGGVASQDP